jgi:hypothetical protein
MQVLAAGQKMGQQSRERDEGRGGEGVEGGGSL